MLKLFVVSEPRINLQGSTLLKSLSLFSDHVHEAFRSNSPPRNVVQLVGSEETYSPRKDDWRLTD